MRTLIALLFLAVSVSAQTVHQPVTYDVSAEQTDFDPQTLAAVRNYAVEMFGKEPLLTEFGFVLMPDYKFYEVIQSRDYDADSNITEFNCTFIYRSSLIDEPKIASYKPTPAVIYPHLAPVGDSYYKDLPHPSSVVADLPWNAAALCATLMMLLPGSLLLIIAFVLKFKLF